MSSQNHPSDLTPSQIADLQQQAISVAHNAYAPYSNFRVGAAILLNNGAIITGCNVENASYRLTTCAEQSAIAAAIAHHGPTIHIRAIVIANLNDTASQPCGACRQTIHEFSTPQTEIFYPSEDNTLARTTMRELLPSAFRLSTDNL
jgi:cytidine deaminase